MEKLSVDRIESDIAVCENEKGKFIYLKLSELPNDVKEGTILLKTEHNTYTIDIEEEKKRRKKLFDLQNHLDE